MSRFHELIREEMEERMLKEKDSLARYLTSVQPTPRLQDMAADTLWLVACTVWAVAIIVALVVL